MKIMKGDMWSALHKANLILVTANSFVKKDGRLVMGRGAARQMRDKFPDVDKLWGRLILRANKHLGMYGIVTSGKLGIFQVKYHWKNIADVDLIEYSANKLAIKAREVPHWQIHMNMPGVGNGRLDIGEVIPAITIMPDNVHVWMYEDS